MEWKVIFRILIIFLFSFSVFAESWEVKSEGDEFLLVSPKGKSYSIQSVGGVPKFLFEKSFQDKYLLAIYQAGTAGTSQPIKVERAIILLKEDHSYVGNAPFRYMAAKGATYKPEQPIWKIIGQVLEVTDAETSKTTKIELTTK